MVDYLLCADWSKQYKGRALYAADVRARKLFRVGPAIFGCRGFGEKMLKKEPDRPRKMLKRRSIETAARDLAKLLELEVSLLRSPDRSWAISKARTTASYVLVRRLGYRLSDVAAYFGRDVASVATLLARLSERMQADDKASREIERLAKIVEL